MTKLAIGFVAITLPLAAAAQVESYNIDPIHTIPYWETDHLGYATMRGHFNKTSGKFTIDRAAKTGTLEITIQTASLNTGDTDREARSRTRDEHLRSPDFFNVSEFPTMTYRATSVKFADDNPDVVEGNFTLLGVTRPVSLKIERWRCGPDPRTAGKRYQCGGNATGSFKRSDFGMKFGLPTAIGDEVKLWTSFYGFRSQ
jgi:polyisoprenoid-binding protein YceI